MLIEARLAWGGDLLALGHAPATGVVRLAELGLPGLGAVDTVVYEDAGLVANQLDVAGATIELSLVADPPRFDRACPDLRAVMGVAVAMLLHAALFTMALGFSVSPDGEVPVETLKAYLAAIDARGGDQTEAEIGPPLPHDVGLREQAPAPVADELENDVWLIGLPPTPRWQLERERAHHIAQCGELSVTNGHLPVEVVRRIVRQSYGRMRFCYEAALTHTTKPSDHMSVKFVVSRSGEVSEATRQDPFEDKEMTACVERAFASLSFPEPEGGDATVVCPLSFST